MDTSNPMVGFVSTFGFKIALLSVVLTLLPNSPFVYYTNLCSQLPYLDVLNWFVPISEILAVIELWLTTVIAWYSIQFIVHNTSLMGS